MTTPYPFTLLLIAILSSCSSSDATTSSPPLHGAAATVSPAARRSLSTLSAARSLEPVIRGRLSFEEGYFGFSVTTGTLTFGGLVALVPSQANGVMRLAHSTKSGVSIEIEAEDVGSTAGELVEGAVVFPGAAPDTDVVHIATGARIEEFRVVRVARDAVTARYRVRIGPALASLRAREGRLEAIDQAGFVHLGTAPIFAVDERGVQRYADVWVVRQDDVFVANVRVDTRGLVFPVVLDPGWSSAATPKFDHSMGPNVLLSSGDVLTTAASSSTVTFAKTELYAPSTNTWSTVGDFASRLGNHALSLLPSGKVLASGGDKGSSGGITNEAQLYDPLTASWSLAGAMAFPRQLHTSTTLGPGKALVVGGSAGSSAEVYDESTNKWTTVGSLTLARLGHAATLLTTGKVLVTGGYNGGVGSLSTAELYDPLAKSWSAAASMSGVRQDHGALFLASGKVLVAGGKDAVGPTLSTAEIYDPATNSWSAAGAMTSRRRLAGLVLLTDGTALVVGGLDGSTGLSSAEIYNPATNTWASTSAMPSPHAAPTMTTRLADGRVLLTDSTTALLFDPSIAAGTCVFDGDCKSTEFCLTGKCTTKPGSDAGADSATDAAVDSATDATADSVSSDTSVPDGPLKKDGEICAGDAQCSSGHCADAICCNVACDGQCQACDVKGKEGVCSVVSGAPRGTRPSCGTDTTCAGKCDGIASLTCTYPPSTTTCGTTCASGMQSSNTCDGKGACVSVGSTSCNGAICDGPKCKESCAADSDCLGGFVCGKDGKCAPAIAAAPAADGGGCGCELPGARQGQDPWALASGATFISLICARRRRLASRQRSRA